MIINFYEINRMSYLLFTFYGLLNPQIVIKMETIADNTITGIVGTGIVCYCFCYITCFAK